MTSSSEFTIRYRIDANDHLVGVDENWQRFAQQNDGESSRPERVIGQKMWDWISDPTLQEIYYLLVREARRGHIVHFHYRCDAPAFRRLFEMCIRSLDGGEVEFASRLISEEARPPVFLLDRDQRRNGEFLRVCSWCQRVAVGANWIPVEDAVETLGLMLKPALPQLTHGICATCQQGVYAMIKGMPSAK